MNANKELFDIRIPWASARLCPVLPSVSMSRSPPPLLQTNRIVMMLGIIMMIHSFLHIYERHRNNVGQYLSMLIIYCQSPSRISNPYACWDVHAWRRFVNRYPPRPGRHCHCHPHIAATSHVQWIKCWNTCARCFHAAPLAVSRMKWFLMWLTALY